MRFTSFDVNYDGQVYDDMRFDLNQDNLGFDLKNQAYDHHVHTYYMQKAQECIKEANTKMLGPNGERLEIVLKDANEVSSSCEYQHNILIVPPLAIYGATYRRYPSDIDNCALITHEILHVFGLRDEKDDRKFNTRPIPYPHVTADRNELSDDQILLYKVSGISEGNSFTGVCVEAPWQYNSIMANIFDRWDNVFKLRRDQSLLDPAHFNAILYGDNCTDREDVHLYNQCYGSTGDEECSIAECHRASVLGRTQQRELEILEHELSTNQESFKREINLINEKNKLPIIIEESVYDSNRQRLLERLEAVRSWHSNEVQNQR